MRSVVQAGAIGTLLELLFAMHLFCMLNWEYLLSLTLICGGLLKSAALVGLLRHTLVLADNLWHSSYERGCCKEDVQQQRTPMSIKNDYKISYTQPLAPTHGMLPACVMTYKQRIGKLMQHLVQQDGTHRHAHPAVPAPCLACWAWPAQQHCRLLSMPAGCRSATVNSRRSIVSKQYHR